MRVYCLVTVSAFISFFIQMNAAQAALVCEGDAVLGDKIFSSAKIKEGDRVLLKDALEIKANQLKIGFYQGDEMPGAGSCHFKPSSEIAKSVNKNGVAELAAKTVMAIGSVESQERDDEGRTGVTFQLLDLKDKTPLFDCSCTDSDVTWVNTTMNGRNYFDYLICRDEKASESAASSGIEANPLSHSDDDLNAHESEAPSFSNVEIK